MSNITLAIGDELKSWLEQQPECKKRNESLYTFKYKDIWCAGIVVIIPPFDILRIMPASAEKDIGAGAGGSVNMKFNRKP